MQLEKAKFFNNYMVGSIIAFSVMLQHKRHSKITTTNEIVIELKDSDFKNYYSNFLAELESNIKEYRDLNLINDYLSLYFKQIKDWPGFDTHINEKIILSGFETNYLIKLKKRIEIYVGKIKDLLSSDSETLISEGLTKYYDEVINLYYLCNYNPNDKDFLEEFKDDSPFWDNRFDFDQMKEESDKLPDNNQKINFINNRLFDLEHWQLINDYEESCGSLNSDKRMHYSNLYYPMFVRHCQIELKRLKFLTDQECKTVSLPQNTNPSPVFSFPYVWKAKDTHLLELVTALYKSDTIGTKDGSSITRKELIEFFAGVFNTEIKDAESKLVRATNRTDDTPFLDKLKRAFKEYIAEKTEKSTARQKHTKVQL